MDSLLQGMPGEQPESGIMIWMRRIATFLVVLLLLIGIGLMVHSLLTGKVSTRKPVTTIKIMPDTPPPTPPPPREQPKEQPREQSKEIRMEQPRPQEAPQPQAEVLKMEGAAGNGPSPFATGTVAKDYKGGDVATKIGGKKGMAAYAWYTDQIKARVEETLAEQKDLAKVQYRVIVHVWLTRDGRIERTELKGSSGDSSTDKLIRKALAGMRDIAEAPPDDMPLLVKLRITSRNAG